MDGRNYGSGFSNWGGGGGGGGSGNRGSGNFDLFGGNYKNSMSGFGGFGDSNSKRRLSGSSILPQKGNHADEVIAKINQRLDMLTQLEGGMKGGRGDRFGQFESFDSLSSSRDLYRSGGSSYGCGDGRGDNMLLGQRGGSGFGGGMGLGGGGSFNSLSSSFGVAKMRQNMRESFTGGSNGGGWAGAGRRSPRRGGGAGGRGSGGGFGSFRSDPMLLGGVGGRGGGHSQLGGRGKLPSLLSNRMYCDGGGFHQGPSQGPHDFPGRHFGGGPRAGRQRGRKRPLNKFVLDGLQQAKPQNDGQKKRKQMMTPADEPVSKINKTEGSESAASNDQQEKNGNDNASTTDVVAEGDSGAPKQQESADVNTNPEDKPTPSRSQTKRKAKMKKKRGFQERVMFACSICKFRSFYKDEMESHLDSRFHKDHFKFLAGQLSKPTTDFLQEYLHNKFEKTQQMVSQLENHSAAICQVYRDQDLTKDIGMEHFLKKVEAAHCSACDVFIPMELHMIQKHIKSHDHNYNRKGMMEQAKRGSLSVARSIVNHKVIGKKLESYLKGENPFTKNQDGEDASEMMVVDATDDQTTSIKEQTELEEVPAQQLAELEAPKEINMEEGGNENEPGVEGTVEEGNPENELEEEGFEVGDERDGEDGYVAYVVHDEVTEDDEFAVDFEAKKAEEETEQKE